ncbi:MAG TPA: hypothetical protein GX391_06825 [Firmicutes bacterium]|nr:hypothetical protein [Bacillota bacterium]HOQ24411.1 hypothetical protein [Bacillota bacterium]HPT67720.1 hypothetical protein [Bacillota bacterium]
METQVRRVAKKGMNALDVAVVAVLLAVGAVLRMTNPIKLGLITPNLLIGMYCLAVLLIRPKFWSLLGIGLVSAALCQVTTASAFPYLNVVSEPVGVMVAAMLAGIGSDTGIFRFLRPAFVTFLATLASGFTYALIFMAIIFLKGTSGAVFSYLTYVVLVTAAVNAVLAGILYQPLKAALGKTK